MITTDMYPDTTLGLWPLAGQRPGLARAEGTAPLSMYGRAAPDYLGMDPLDPGTHVRPYNPSTGMLGRLEQDQATQPQPRARKSRRRRQ